MLEHNKKTLEETGIALAISDLMAEDTEHRKKSFAKVYENDEWGKALKSGPGSLVRNSLVAIKVLNIVVEKLKKILGKEKIR